MAHTVEKIGGTSMSRFGEIMRNVIIADCTGESLYNLIFVVSAYAGITNLLLEDKKTGAPGVYGHIAADSPEWPAALEKVRARMIEYNHSFAELGLDVKAADAFINERLDGILDSLNDIMNLRTSGFRPADYLPATREFLRGGEVHSAWKTRY